MFYYQVMLYCVSAKALGHKNFSIIFVLWLMTLCLLHYDQDEYKDPDEEAEKEERAKSKSRSKKGIKGDKDLTPIKKVLTVEEGHDTPLTGIGIYLLRTSTKRTLG